MRDTDGDGVIDILDCRPYNKKLQHIKPNIAQRKRIEKLPIFVSDKPFSYIHILAKDAKKVAPKARITALAMIKKYPSLIGEIERKKPPEILFASFSISDLGNTEIETRNVKVYPPQKREDTKKGYFESGSQYIKQHYNPEDQPYHLKTIKHHLKRYGFKDETTHLVEKKKRYSMAHTTFHELQHVKQMKTKKGKEKVVKELEIPQYWKRKSEIEAEVFAEKKLKEYERLI